MNNGLSERITHQLYQKTVQALVEAPEFAARQVTRAPSWGRPAGFPRGLSIEAKNP